MTKTGTLETISYKQRRVKINNSWLSVDPFADLDSLKFGNSYEIELELEKGTWYITTFKEVVK